MNLISQPYDIPTVSEPHDVGSCEVCAAQQEAEEIGAIPTSGHATSSSDVVKQAQCDYGLSNAAADFLVKELAVKQACGCVERIEALQAEWRAGRDAAYSERHLSAEVRLSTKIDAGDEIITALSRIKKGETG